MPAEDLRDYGDDPYVADTIRSREDAEYRRGIAEAREAQSAGPPGSAAREAAYLEMELRAARDGDDW